MTEAIAWTRNEKLVLVLFASALFASLWVLVHPWYDSTYGDSALYIGVTRSLVAGDGYTYLGAPFRAHPPGFPVILSPVIALFGTNFHALNLFIAALGALCVVLLVVYLRPHLGTVLAFATGAAVWLNPGFRRLSNDVMADVPGVAFLLGCLLVDRWANRHPGWRRELVLGLCVGVAVYVRSMNGILVPAIAASRLIGWWIEDRNLRSAAVGRVALFVSVAFLTLLPWTIRDSTRSPSAPADQTLVDSYFSGMWNRDPGDPESPRFSPAEVLARAPVNAEQILKTLGNRMSGGRRGLVDLLFGVILLACSFRLLLERRAAAEFFVLGALALLLVYFDVRDRLLLPIFVLALPAAFEVLRGWLTKGSTSRSATAASGAAILLLVAVEFDPRPSWESVEQRHGLYKGVSSAIASRLEPDARIGAGLGFHYGVYLERPVYSLLFAVRREGSPEAVEAVIDRYGLDTIVLSPLVGFDMTLLPYFEERYGDAEEAWIASVIRVRP
jgi:4-amino-4-deoxy-L-arabinose transferase-like glycosyltransferase